MLGLFAIMTRLHLPNMVISSALHELEQELQAKMTEAEQKAWGRAAVVDMATTLLRRVLVVLDTGALGLGFYRVQEGDKVVIIWGCSTPVILRERGGDFVLIGDAFVDGFMYGEGVERLERGEFLEETFRIF